MKQLTTKQNAQAVREGMQGTTGAKLWNELFGRDDKNKKKKAQDSQNLAQQQSVMSRK